MGCGHDCSHGCPFWPPLPSLQLLRITMDEWDTQQAQLDDADEEGAVLALAEGCAAFRAGVAADDDDVELVGVQTPAERAAESRRRAEAEGKVLEIEDDVEFLGTRQAEQRPVRRHLAEPPRRKSPPPRDTIRTFGGSTAKPTGGRCACASCAAIAKFAAYPACSVSAPPELIIDGETWRARQHVMDALDARYGGILVYAVRTEKEKAPCVVIKRGGRARSPVPAPAPAPPKRARARGPPPPPREATRRGGFAISARSRTAAGLEPLVALAPTRRGGGGSTGTVSRAKRPRRRPL